MVHIDIAKQVYINLFRTIAHLQGIAADSETPDDLLMCVGNAQTAGADLILALESDPAYRPYLDTWREEAVRLGRQERAVPETVGSEARPGTAGALDREALALVLELAEQNALVYEEVQQEPDLYAERDRQLEAIEAVRAYLEQQPKAPEPVLPAAVRHTLVEGTNITHEAKGQFEAIIGAGDSALVSCFYDGEPTSCIARISRDEEGNYLISPVLSCVSPFFVLSTV